jgi:serine/threonine-protein kinase
MAELYLARTGDPERLVALKRLRAQLALDPEFIRMFLDEGRLAMTLRHPNVVEVHEVGEDAGQY